MRDKKLSVSMQAYTEKPCYPELVLAILTGVGHVALQVATGGLQTPDAVNRPQHLYNLVAAVLWAVYLFIRATRTPGAAKAWGFGKTGFAPAIRAGALLTAAAAIPLVWYARNAQTLPLPPSFWFTLAIYPVWGIAQQFALQALVTRNLRQAVPRPPMRVLAASLLFSASHFPDYPLMAFTLLGGIVFTAIFEKWRNLWAVGIAHGILGAMVYYLALGRDPGATIIEMMR